MNACRYSHIHTHTHSHTFTYLHTHTFTRKVHLYSAVQIQSVIKGLGHRGNPALRLLQLGHQLHVWWWEAKQKWRRFKQKKRQTTLRCTRKHSKVSRQSKRFHCRLLTSFAFGWPCAGTGHDVTAENRSLSTTKEREREREIEQREKK